MNRQYDPKNRHRLDSEERRDHMPPVETLKTLGLRQNDIFADIGCGIGYFTLEAAEKILDGSQPIYAIDISEVMLETLEERRVAQGIRELEMRLTDGRNLPLEDVSVTFLLMVNVFHEVPDPRHTLMEIERVLKPGGRFALIEWRKESMEEGPPLDHRIAKEEIVAYMEGGTFTLRKTHRFTHRYDGWVFQKKGDPSHE